MQLSRIAVCWRIVVVTAVASAHSKAAPAAVPLPPGITAVWDLAKADRVTTPTRERICVNGLWRWQPAPHDGDDSGHVPAGGWGYFKVPGCWPGITDYMQKDCQTVWPHPSWADRKLGDVM